jgi:hypothetical protein
MCDPVSIGMATMTAMTMMNSERQGGGGMSFPNAQLQPLPPTPELQAPKTPDQAALRPGGGAQATGAAMGSAGSTLLTGGGGVSPSLLSLGKNTLLGQ